ncbi:MAG: monofunctional biosynthetic peptidoglycan transglycosylase [Pelodictyon luteolum]|uniref:Biosynthetic peptidoglycan transglycosylase n=1 Tax=Pelodictyon luteolum TaxID=1100 RepID=A0A165M0B3_PELLU|nr:monofunctional biosynthetic peptidoglycan transglycosylase [Pelodictyon luteolum]KZK74651.1 MAG: monofunctional biosynthetic peptidoglycan transglycosylase [Pelodictyon luteolum]
MKFLRNIAILLFCLFVVDIMRYFVIPDVEGLARKTPETTAFMQYRVEAWRRAGYPGRETERKVVPLRAISKNVVRAVLIAEDDKFWQHDGFDYEAMERALEKNLKERKIAMGGSTVSQQLAKNLYLSPSKNPVRKIKEAILTWRIERSLSKRRILELYLNSAEWGDGIFGIEAAARHYYGVSASRLNARQASRLAAVLPNPIRWSPTGSSRYVRNRSAIIYRIMQKRGGVAPSSGVRAPLPVDTTATVADTITIGVPRELIDEVFMDSGEGGN